MGWSCTHKVKTVHFLLSGVQDSVAMSSSSSKSKFSGTFCLSLLRYPHFLAHFAFLFESEVHDRKFLSFLSSVYTLDSCRQVVHFCPNYYCFLFLFWYDQVHVAKHLLIDSFRRQIEKCLISETVML